MSTSTLFAATAIVLTVLAIVFAATWQANKQDRYWLSWIAANILMAGALTTFLVAPVGRASSAVEIGNCLLVAAFGLRWRAARLFARRSAPWLPVAFATGLGALISSMQPERVTPGALYTTTNVFLAVLAGATAWEFWRDRADQLPSRMGLVAAYGLISASFAVRILHGALFGSSFVTALPHDSMLLGHLLVGLVYATASGGFALSLAYEASAAQLRTAALTDALTELPNRRCFEERLSSLFATHGDELALVLLDVDRFKTVNDTHGHAAGDCALQLVARSLRRVLPPDALPARIGGEEFAVILPRHSSAAAVKQAEEMRASVSALDIESEVARFRISLSVGVADRSADMRSPQALVTAADRALYEAKRRGRDRVETWSHHQSRDTYDRFLPSAWVCRE